MNEDQAIFSQKLLAILDIEIYCDSSERRQLIAVVTAIATAIAAVNATITESAPHLSNYHVTCGSKGAVHAPCHSGLRNGDRNCSEKEKIRMQVIEVKSIQHFARKYTHIVREWKGCL